MNLKQRNKVKTNMLNDLKTILRGPGQHPATPEAQIVLLAFIFILKKHHLDLV